MKFKEWKSLVMNVILMIIFILSIGMANLKLNKIDVELKFFFLPILLGILFGGIITHLTMKRTRYLEERIREKTKELEKLAYVDYLTGLSTRRMLDEKYSLLFESAKRSENILTLIMIDIDHFKKYNDRYGHQDGDRVLKIMGGLLKEVFKRDGDVVSRYGGEEFAVVLYQTPLKDIISLVEEFREKLKDCNIEHKDSPFGELTVSIGINNGKISMDQNSDIFLRKVDKALYKAKESGRNRYCF